MELKTKTKTKLKKDLDAIFSKYIRLRDSDEYGFANCCTCGAHKFWKELQNGHWITRGVLATRYDEYNCHAQCMGCNYGFGNNSGGKGKPHLHELYIVDYHGEDIRDALLQKSKTIKPFIAYEKLICYYKDQVEELKKLKGL